MEPSNLGPRPGSRLSAIYGIDARQSYYSANGSWYTTPSIFPLALWDPHGYVRFAAEEDYLNSPYLQRGTDLNVPNGISSIPGYDPVRS